MPDSKKIVSCSKKEIKDLEKKKVLVKEYYDNGMYDEAVELQKQIYQKQVMHMGEQNADAMASLEILDEMLFDSRRIDDWYKYSQKISIKLS